jgi:hypothetical protein
VLALIMFLFMAALTYHAPLDPPVEVVNVGNGD